MTEAEFLEWANAQGDDWGPKTATLYRMNLTTALATVQDHEFFRELNNRLVLWDSAEKDERGISLLMHPELSPLQIKPFSSVINKAYRKNIVNNRKYPNPPEEGWVTPSNCYERINDLIRGALVSKFVDGPRRVAEQMKALADELHLESRYDAEGRDQGYYAYHFYVFIPVEIATPNLESRTISMRIEIQISSQLQEVLRKITHEFYEQRRNSVEADAQQWKWDFQSNQFRAGYVSHTLHLIEAIIVQLRDDVLRKPR